MHVDNLPWDTWLLQTHRLHDWDHTCELAERHLPPLAHHLSIWGPHCGAPRAIYRGHLVRLLIDLADAPRNAQEAP